MAEEQKETFGQKVDNYANQYEAALRENAEAFRKVGMECIAKGIKTAEEVVQDAKNAGIVIKQQTLDQMKKAESFVKQKATETKSKVTEVKGKVVTRAGEIKDGVVEGAAKTTEAFVTVGRLGKNVAIKGAKTIQGTSEKVYSAAKGTAQKGLTAVGKWFQARGKDIRDAKDAVVTKAGQVRDGVKDKAETAAIYGMMAGDKVVETARKVKKGAKDAVETVAIYGLEAKDRVVDAAETAAIYGMMAGDKVVETAGKVKDGVVDGAAKTAGAFVAAGRLAKEGAEITVGAAIITGRLGKNAVIKGAKTIQGTSEKVYSAAKGTAQKGLTAVGKWFQARGKDIRDAKDAVVTKAGQVRDGVKDKAETAAIYGMMAGDKVVETARKVKKGAKDAVETVAIYGLEAKDRVVDAAETAAIYGMMAGDKVVETAGKVKDGVVDGAAKVVAVPVTAKNMTQEMLQRASSRVQTRANTTIASMARSGRNFADALFDRLENSAISREERNQEAMKAREAAKAKEESSKDQDDPSK